MVINSKGQAALSDALYFLMIVGGISTFLFFFSINYGLLVKEQVGLQYRSEYATSALKTLLYSSIPRIEGQTLEEATEVDFLLAAVKEDFADNGDLNNMQNLVVNNVIGLMEPVADSFNYLYYIYLPEKEQFAFFMLYASRWSWATDRGMRVEDVGEGSSIIYLCKPSLLEKLDPLIINVGTLYQANSRMQLVRLKEARGRGYDIYPAQVNLTMWIATALPETVTGNILDESHLNCTCFKELKEGKWQGCR